MSQAELINDGASNVSEKDDGSKDRSSSKSKSSSSAASKSKDLSHVPCKFFKVGSCTAGPSCPFSHHALEPGHQKDVCAWFVKGNCKFGHKCALAHLLPGQSMNMDRRNKKAAQLASSSGRDRDGAGARGSGPGEGNKPGAGARASQRSSGGVGADGPPPGLGRAGGGGGAQGRSNGNALLVGQTAPTRMLSLGGRPPMSISKAAPAPPATAPALDDNDFTSFERTKSAESGADNKALLRDGDGAHAGPNGASATGLSPPPPSSSYIPISTPTETMRFTGRHGASPAVDFGPVGSPPRASPSNPIRINGFSPGTSPNQPAPPVSTTTFSAPGPSSAQSLFMHFERSGQTDDLLNTSRSGLAMSLGATNGFGLMPQKHSSSSGYTPGFGAMREASLDDDDMEEFVPSSLKDLLTPEEQIRRITRTTSSNMTATLNNSGNRMAPPFTQATANTGGLQDSQQHRYSRSVPAQSILQDIRSIWSEPYLQTSRSPQQNSFDHNSQSAISSGLGLGAPSSFKASSLLRSTYEDGPSPSMLSPSNASAAFLPGLQQQYLARTGSRAGIPTLANNRTVSHGHVPTQQLPSSLSQDISRDLAAPYQNPYAPHAPTANSLSSGMVGLGHSLYASHNNHNGGIGDYQQHSTGRPIPSNGGYGGAGGADAMPLFSPSTRALQAHAPGQSLPQGLAAGYSRIHLQPGASGLSPNSAAFSPGNNFGMTLGSPPLAEMDSTNGGLDWRGLTPTTKPVVGPPAAAAAAEVNHSSSSTPVPQQAGQAQGSEKGAAGDSGESSGLSSMFSRLSYSAAAARGTAAAAPATNAPPSSSPHPISASTGTGASAVGMVPMSMSRKTSGGRAWPGGAQQQPLSSPLSKPAISNDDDELFTWDEEK